MSERTDPEAPRQAERLEACAREIERLCGLNAGNPFLRGILEDFGAFGGAAQPAEALRLERAIIRVGAPCDSSKHDGVHSAMACWKCGGSMVNAKRAATLRKLLDEYRAALSAPGHRIAP